MKFQYLLTAKTTRFQKQFHRRYRYRVLVGWVEIKITTSDQQVFRVWRFENYDPAGFERPPGFVEKPHECFEWKMLGEVKSSDGAQASIRQRSEVRKRLTLDHIQRQVFALLDHNPVLIDSASQKSCFAKQLEPLAASASDVEYVRLDPRLLQHG